MVHFKRASNIFDQNLFKLPGFFSKTRFKPQVFEKMWGKSFIQLERQVSLIKHQNVISNYFDSEFSNSK
jgi:hypothetical protein